MVAQVVADVDSMESSIMAVSLDHYMRAKITSMVNIRLNDALFSNRAWTSRRKDTLRSAKFLSRRIFRLLTTMFIEDGPWTTVIQSYGTETYWLLVDFHCGDFIWKRLPHNFYSCFTSLFFPEECSCVIWKTCILQSNFDHRMWFLHRVHSFETGNRS